MSAGNQVGGGGSYGNEGVNHRASSGEIKPEMDDDFVDVAEDEGWIILLDEEFTDTSRKMPHVTSFCSLDRSFVFPGEEIHMLACLSMNEPPKEDVTPFEDVDIMAKDSVEHSTKKVMNPSHHVRKEDHMGKTEKLLQSFKSSHFFVRIAESDEELWSKRSSEASDDSKSSGQESSVGSLLLPKHAEKRSSFNVIVDKGSRRSYTSGGVARSAAKCFPLPNGDIVVQVQIKVSGDVFRDPVLEVVQFEKYEDTGRDLRTSDEDPFGELLRWLLPLDNYIPRARVLSPSPASNAGIRSTSNKPNFSISSGSQLFSFGHNRSHSMSSLPPNNVGISNSKLIYDPQDWDRFSLQKSEKNVSSRLLSFRGVSLEPKRFSVPSGLEGMYIPGRRWRRKIEIVQPLEINSLPADCNSEDHLCVQIKNIAPAHVPNIVVYIDAVSIVAEDASRGGSPSCFPTAFIEAGNEHGLPNLALRRGEEHSFILKPAISLWKNFKSQIEASLKKSRLLTYSSYVKWIHCVDQFAILVSYRNNYTESRLFSKQRISWHPRLSRDLLLSVASNASKDTVESSKRLFQLPIQVLTLQASNLTSDDLTLTVVAPALSISFPSMMSLRTSPLSPLTPRISSSMLAKKEIGQRRRTTMRKSNSTPRNLELKGEGGSQSVQFDDRTISSSDVQSKCESGFTHLWLQSEVPLGSVPPHSTSIVKLEVLPLIDGIIALDSLQIDDKERGITYIPEHSLKIKASSKSFQ